MLLLHLIMGSPVPATSRSIKFDGKGRLQAFQPFSTDILLFLYEHHDQVLRAVVLAPLGYGSEPPAFGCPLIEQCLQEAWSRDIRLVRAFRCSFNPIPVKHRA